MILMILFTFLSIIEFWHSVLDFVDLMLGVVRFVQLVRTSIDSPHYVLDFRDLRLEFPFHRCIAVLNPIRESISGSSLVLLIVDIVFYSALGTPRSMTIYVVIK